MAVAEELQLNPDAAPAVPLTPVESMRNFAQSPMGKNFLRGLGVAALVGVGFALYLWNQPPEYRVLFSNFTDRDGGAITASLDQLNIKHKFSEGGGAILVPTEQVHDARLKLAAQGLPKGGNVGFELMENQKLGVSQFLEQVNFQRALEGELAKSIQSVGAVDSARVHLALPKPSVFVREQQKPTASVLLNLHPGRALDQLQVSAIVHLVASSVPELLPANVTLVDQAGNLLSNNDKDKAAAGKEKNLDPNQLKYVQQLQQSVIKQVESIIAPIVGADNVRAEATADVDFSQVEQAAETYKPNSPPEASSIRSQQTSESTGPANANPAGVPGALSNQPPGVATAPLTATAPTGAAAAPAAPTQKDSTTNYEVDKTVRYEQKSMGGLRRLSVAVVVNYRRSVGKDGKINVTPLSPADLVQINNLVKEAMGYNKERGDSFSVANSRFDGVDRPAEPTLDWWRDAANLPLAKELAKFLITALILLYLFIKIVRPMLRPVFRKIDDFAAPPPVIEEVVDEEEKVDEEMVSQQALATMEADTARGYRENLAMAKKLASEDPRVVANVIKAWIGNND
ncbi:MULTISPECIES: flagellar basal-body MS-ring/collar protein FliF [unclassified Janthinobacterium]|uniref:flagellar basal-body MS-ring/collar protein FliF n=1 Tax=unclassified Janthinobacterium TaxID=2610881 RepID=UPI00047722ED|nr:MULTISPECIES: flagellar basal-body MS-ring/collar protein FliF [unclassified Janthinobacterium]MEC5162276.1 flagellar M-ring protein FliF [Janthinobacterium sp. CG_S6]